MRLLSLDRHCTVCTVRTHQQVLRPGRGGGARPILRAKVLRGSQPGGGHPLPGHHQLHRLRPLPRQQRRLPGPGAAVNGQLQELAIPSGVLQAALQVAMTHIY